MGRAGWWFAALLLAAPARAADDYTLGPDSEPQPGVALGTLEKFAFGKSRIFPGTVRDYWVSVPAQYRPDVPACLMVFQDGERFAKLDGAWRVPVVIANLIHKKEMPVTIGVYVNPGVLPAPGPAASARYNRSVEYDGMSDAYVRFLLEELLPEVGRRYRLSADPNCRGIGGSSSGGIAAFTAAWHRPDAFRRVYSSIGTYVGLRGGDAYPTLVRKAEPRPIRVYLQDGSNDNDGYGGSWWWANNAMLSALSFAGYEVAHAFGDGGHTAKHGAAVLPDALRFLWKGWPAAPKAGAGSKQPVREVVDGADWQVAAEVGGRIGGVAVAPGGAVFWSEVEGKKIWRLGGDGKAAVVVPASGGATGLAVGGDGRILAAQPERKRVVAFDAKGAEAVMAEGVVAAEIVVSHAGLTWASEPSTGRVLFLAPGKPARAVATGLPAVRGLALTTDQAFLQVGDARGRFVTSFEALPDGSLAHGQAFCHLHLDDTITESGAGGIAVDVMNRPFVATRIGVQFCDQAGRVNGIISTPSGATHVVFGGAAMDTLFAVAGRRIHRRQTKVRGVISIEAPLKPPAPRL